MKTKKNGRIREDASRRAALLSAAARLMRTKGYAAATIREMASAVGMGSGSPFCHFRSKQEILSEIATESMQRALSRAQRLAARHAQPRCRLQALMRLHSQLLHGEDGDFVAVMLHEWRALPPETQVRVAHMQARYEAIWRECIEALEEAGHLHADAVLTARLMLGSLNWSLNWYRGNGPLDQRQLADAVTTVFLAGPAAPAGEARRHAEQPALAAPE
jgi:AcrR family transcriptional regulator